MQGILLKPHHFVDIICSFGKGERKFYPHHYGHGVHIISDKLLKTPNCHIQIEIGIDDICLPCKYNTYGLCVDEIDNSYRPTAPKSKQQWNMRIDTRWCEFLELKQGDLIESVGLIQRIEKNIGNLFTIYQEIPIEMIKKRKMNLIMGLKFTESLMQ